MKLNLNCIYNDKGDWCTNKNIKRSLFGLGARYCIVFPCFDTDACQCSKKYPKPKILPQGQVKC